MSLLKLLNEYKLIAILRKVPDQKINDTIVALKTGGIKFFEVTMNSPNALKTIDRWRSQIESGLIMGAGTVLNVQMAKDAISAGANFLISPNLNEEVIYYSREQNVDIWPGVMSPTEIVRAYNSGAEAVKLFPAGTLGTDYIRNVKGPLDRIPIIATGGVNLENITEFYKAGSFGFGLGSSLIDLKLIEVNRFNDLSNLATKYVETVSSFERV